jgi:hypothetical protein
MYKKVKLEDRKKWRLIKMTPKYCVGQKVYAMLNNKRIEFISGHIVEVAICYDGFANKAVIRYRLFEHNEFLSEEAYTWETKELAASYLKKVAKEELAKI